MPSKIHILSDSIINKIAAGEVIENPSSVVKELVENALDAGSTEITVEIKEGGRQLIRVSDNGYGMSADDALLCLERHATSKIRDIEDIQTLATMGFRGEAIPSIAAISKFTLLTCLRKEEEKNQEGTMVIVEGGKLITCSPAVRTSGTTVEVKSLFFNVPVRKKFQKSPSYDVQEILKLINTLAIGHPSIQFELLSDHRLLLKTSIFSDNCIFREKLSYRIGNVLGRDFLSATCSLSFHQEPYQLEGYIGLPTHHRPNRMGQYLFINHRAVYSPFISFAIREGYGTALASNRYPLFVLHLQMPNSLIDVNVHPQKKEIRLRQEHLLKESLIQAVQAALKAYGFAEGRVPFNPFIPAYETLLSPDPTVSTQPQKKLNEQLSYPSPLSLPLYESKNSAQSVLPFYSPKKVVEEEPWTFFSLVPQKQIPRVSTTICHFILIEFSTLDPSYPFAKDRKGQEGLCLIDQRAAYSRIHYERLLKSLSQTEKSQTFIQPLLIPLTVDFPPLEAAFLKEHLLLLNGIGFSIQEFGDNTFIMDAIPQLCKTEEAKMCLSAIIQDLREFQDTRRLQREKEKQVALAISRVSLPSTRRLALNEAQVLVNQLFDCDTPFQCPWGKPTLAYYSYEDLIKQFQK